jgi:hypothetical protein
MKKSYEQKVEEYKQDNGKSAKKHAEKVLKRKANADRTSSVLAKERRMIKSKSMKHSKADLSAAHKHMEKHKG